MVGLIQMWKLKQVAEYYFELRLFDYLENLRRTLEALSVIEAAEGHIDYSKNLDGHLPCDSKNVAQNNEKQAKD